MILYFLLVLFSFLLIVITCIEYRNKKRITELIQKPFRQDDEVYSSDTGFSSVLRKSSKAITKIYDFDKNLKLKLSVVVLFVLLTVSVWSFGLINLSINSFILICCLVVIFVILLPSKIEEFVKKKKLKQISNDTPYLIDILCICIQSGMTIEASIDFISGKLIRINRELSLILKKTYSMSEISGINVALEQLKEECENEEIKMLCTTLLQSTKLGASIYPILSSLSYEMRKKSLLEMEEKVASLSARMTIPMIAFILFPLIIVVAGPGFIRMGEMF
ncbi:type II secretion system F family protein [Escherichia albertii]|uniref:type II secretion system F family protein n=1 Tax=Escherichia albertii TaxID=208962 RepID=UPI000CF646A4|nr:type II secretion system F family protein [Escherichia albertii]EFB5188744.1 type II secretion system F family protein [Escherichia albertii]EJQ6145866.1 type II secretion system F family protein [Escherichia albertii]MCZ9127448.1 type II secretion system F family protein [Escherichia albertii]